MNTLAKASPLKRKKEEAAAPKALPRTLLTPGVEGWPCPDRANCREGLLKIVKKKDGGEFLTCDHNIWKDPTSCKVSLSLLKPSKDHPHLCTLCLKDVGGKPSLGTSTGETDNRGFTIWENIHGVFAHCCAGAKTSDGQRFKNATTAGPEHVGKTCFTYDPEGSPVIDLDTGCTGVIADDDLVLKDWEDPPLHLICAKRAWTKTVTGILEDKQQLRELNSTADKEAAQPSAQVPAHPADF